MDSELYQFNLVVVGDGSVGKTCILVSYTTDTFPKEYVPTVFENYTSHLQVDGKMVNLSLWQEITFTIMRDTAGQETYSQLRSLSYGQADIFLVVFSVVDGDSFENVLNKVIWYNDLSSGELKNVPKLVIGNKIDLRNASSEKHIQKSTFKAEKLLAEKNLKYLECSARSQEGLKEVFEEAVRLVLAKKGKEQLVSKVHYSSSVKKQPKDEVVSHEKPCCVMF